MKRNVLKDNRVVPRFFTSRDHFNWVSTLTPTKYKIKAERLSSEFDARLLGQISTNKGSRGNKDYPKRAL